MWKIIVKKKVGKELSRLPLTVRARLLVLLDHLAAKGPVQPMWPNYSKLSKTSYHCHLNHHYVACWTATEKTITIEVYYVGSREGAPY